MTTRLIYTLVKSFQKRNLNFTQYYTYRKTTVSELKKKGKVGYELYKAHWLLPEALSTARLF